MLRIMWMFPWFFPTYLGFTSVEAQTSCLQEEFIPRLERIEKLVTELQHTISLKQQQEHKNTKELDYWSGNQYTFGAFKRLPDSVKRNLKIFALENTEDLEISVLLKFLRPCINLEVLRLENVEIIGHLPNTTETKLLLPRLHEFRVTLSNYPNLGMRNLLDGILFFKKFPGESLDLDKLVDYNVNVLIGVTGWRKLGINHEFGEFVFDATMDDYQILPKMLQTINTSETFILKRLSLDSGRSLDSSLIPSDLSYLFLANTFLDGELYQLPEYSKLVKRNTMLKELHFITPGRNDKSSLDLDVITHNLKRLSVSFLPINSTKSKLFEIEEVLLNECELQDPTVENFGRLFHRVQKMALLHSFFGDSYAQCHPTLYNLLLSSNRKLNRIYITGCHRRFEKIQKPEGYEYVEKMLAGAGIGNDTHDFLLEKDGENWIGKNTSKIEKMEIIYRMSGLEKLRTWEKFIRNI